MNEIKLRNVDKVFEYSIGEFLKEFCRIHGQNPIKTIEAIFKNIEKQIVFLGPNSAIYRPTIIEDTNFEIALVANRNPNRPTLMFIALGK